MDEIWIGHLEIPALVMYSEDTEGIFPSVLYGRTASKVRHSAAHRWPTLEEKVWESSPSLSTLIRPAIPLP